MSHDVGRVSEEQLDGIEQPGEVDENHDNSPELYLATCGRCDARWHGQAIAHCAGHLTFTSVTGFDIHRYEGRCRSTDELRGLGYEPNSGGHWRKPIEEAPLHWGECMSTGVALPFTAPPWATSNSQLRGSRQG